VIQLVIPEIVNRLGVLRFPRQAGDFASVRAELWKLRDANERRVCVDEQQALLNACVANQGCATQAAWDYIRAHSGEKAEVAAVSGAF
jgi:hypothetical protein